MLSTFSCWIETCFYRYSLIVMKPTHEAMFGAPCPGRRLSSADCLLQRKLFNVTKKVRESRWMIQMWSRWIACELVYSKGMRKLGRNVIWEEKKSIYGIDGVCVFFGRLIRCLIRIRSEFSKMLQLLFRQAVDFDGFSVAPRLNSCRRLWGGVAFWSRGNATFFCGLFQLPGRLSMTFNRARGVSFLCATWTAKKSENGKVQKWLTCIQLSQKIY